MNPWSPTNGTGIRIYLSHVAKIECKKMRIRELATLMVLKFHEQFSFINCSTGYLYPGPLKMTQNFISPSMWLGLVVMDMLLRSNYWRLRSGRLVGWLDVSLILGCTATCRMN